MTGLGDTHTDAEIEELCRLMLGLDRARLLAVLERLEDRGALTEWQSSTLADAMRLALVRDPKFAHGLGERVSKGVLSMAERDSLSWGRALAPAMGPAIRNAVRLMLQGFVNSIETVVNERLSWRSLRWRIEAWRTRRPFAEVVFRNTLLFRVEHVFLVHREGGVQLLHASPADVVTREPDLIAAMLTAIQDFVRDAFEVPSGDTLTSFAVGDLRVGVESGSHAVLAAVVRGQPPASLRLQLREALDAIESSLGEQLAHFDGDTEHFELAGPFLETCLIRSERPGHQPRQRKRWLPWALLGAAVFGLVWMTLGWIDAAAVERRLEAFLTEARREPGILITAVEPVADGWRVRGLADPLSRPIDAIASAHRLTGRIQFAMQPQYALLPEFVLRRVTAALAPPPEVAVALNGDRLLLSGSANHQWCERAATIARVHPGIASTDFSDLLDTDEAAWAATAASLSVGLKPMAALMLGVGAERRQLVAKTETLLHLGRILDRPVVLRCTLWLPSGDNVMIADRDGRAFVERLGRELGCTTGFTEAKTNPALAERMLQFEVVDG